MSETLSFPGLGLEFDLQRIAFTVFGFPIYWYGIIIAAAFLVGAVYAMSRCRTFGLDADRVMDVILGGVLLGIVGARLYYVAFSWDTYKDDLLTIFNVRKGGLAIYGGIIGAVLGAVIMCKWRRVRLAPLLDLVAGGILVGQGIGRWANFVNIEAFGSNTSAAWGMTSPTIQGYLQMHKADLNAIGVVVDPTVPVHPTFLYESIWCLLGFGLIAWYTKRRRFDGELALIYLGWYGLGRFFIEGLRTDSLLIGTLRVSQLLALICFFAALIIFLLIHSRIRREGDPTYMQLYVQTEEGQSVLAGEFYKKKDKQGKKAEAAKEDEEQPADEAKDADAAEGEETDPLPAGEGEPGSATGAADAEAADEPEEETPPTADE